MTNDKRRGTPPLAASFIGAGETPALPAKPIELAFEATKSSGTVGALLTKPPNASSLLVFAHGAGADMRNRFMEAISDELASRGVATLRYQFPYSERNSRRPDPQPILLATVRAAVAFAAGVSGGLPLFAGGKSMGGRMTSIAASEGHLPQIRGIIFFGFPLHSAGAPSPERAKHLSKVKVPMLFLQGTRDALADLSLVKPVCTSLGDLATLMVIDGADHSFRVPKKTGKTDADVFRELAGTAADWSNRIAEAR